VVLSWFAMVITDPHVLDGFAGLGWANAAEWSESSIAADINR